MHHSESNHPLINKMREIQSIIDAVGGDDVDTDSLAYLVFDTADRMASNVNNSGAEDQIEFLLENGWSKEEIIERLKQE